MEVKKCGLYHMLYSSSDSYDLHKIQHQGMCVVYGLIQELVVHSANWSSVKSIKTMNHTFFIGPIIDDNQIEKAFERKKNLDMMKDIIE